MPLRPLVVAATLAASALAAALPEPSPVQVPGTYRVQATARITGVSLLRELELRADVVITPGAGGRDVGVRLASRGHVCPLTARVADGGALTLPAGQRCRILLDEPGTRGAVEATLRSGRGRVADRRLELELAVALEGSVRVTTGGIPGFELETELPVSGEATVRAEGTRDDSRATVR